MMHGDVVSYAYDGEMFNNMSANDPNLKDVYWDHLYDAMLTDLKSGTTKEKYTIYGVGWENKVFMKRKILLAFSIGVILLSACGKEEEQVVKEEISYLEDKLAEGQAVSDLEGEEAENAFYQMFYGEWEITECVYLDKIPVRGVEYTEEEILEVSQEILAGAWKKIQFTRDRIVIDDNQMWEMVRYNIIIFPSDNDYMLHFTMKLQDIGITEEAGKYYVLVEVEGEERGKITFFVKDEDTIIVYKNSYCIEYRRISFEGGNQEPAIILG